MKRSTLRKTLTLRFVFLVLVVIFLISLAANVLINRQFERYMEQQQRTQAEELAQNLSQQYDSMAQSWNLDYIHGLGMYALNEGYLIKLYDNSGAVLWDAENHDMTLCHQMMEDISLRMQETRPDLEGNFITQRFNLEKNNETVGFLDVSYYSPYDLRENEFQFIRSLNQILLLVGGVSLVAAVIMGWILANNLAKSVETAVEITKQISEGEYGIRFQGEVKTKELAQLAQSVNQMAASLERQEGLRKRLTADVAHELRTPLANVTSYLEAIQEGVWEPTPERLQTCYEELERLSKLVSDLERLRQAEEELPLRKTEVDLLELAQTTAESFDTGLAEKHLRCIVRGPHVHLLADPARLRQVMTNLVSNAIKYSADQGSIVIQTEETADTAILRVEDEGIGIAPEEQHLIFERFYRTDRSRSRKTGGTGIGLTIVKAIVTAHGGTITVESQVGQGSCFLVTLPKA